MADMVRRSNEDKTGNKIIIPLIIILVFVSVVLFLIIRFYKNSKPEPATTTVATTVKTTALQAETIETTTKAEKVFPDGEGAILASGRFYISGTLYTNKASKGMHITAFSDGENSQICSAYSNMWLGLLTFEEKKYFVDLTSKSYIDYTEDAFKQLGVQSIPFDITLFGDFSSRQFIESNVTLDGEKCKSFIAQRGNCAIEIITCDGKVKQLNVTNSALSLNYCIIAEEVSAQIPTDRLTLTGYTKSTSLFSFFSAIIH